MERLKVNDLNRPCNRALYRPSRALYEGQGGGGEGEGGGYCRAFFFRPILLVSMKGFFMVFQGHPSSP